MTQPEDLIAGKSVEEIEAETTVPDSFSRGNNSSQIVA